MTPEEMRANLEEEFRWRQEELIFLKNQLTNINSSEKQNKYRKSLVSMLYAHFEGFVKISLQTYIQFLNSLNITCDVVNSNIVASSLDDEFKAYDNLDRKSQIFKRELPEDTKLHRFFRRVDFLNELQEFLLRKIVSIDDQAIDTESNLRAIVLKKNLYKVGLPIDLFEEHASDIDALVNRRNSIAHGNLRSGVTEKEYTNWETKIYRIMSDIIMLLYDYACNEKYLEVDTRN